MHKSRDILARNNTSKRGCDPSYKDPDKCTTYIGLAMCLNIPPCPLALTHADAPCPPPPPRKKRNKHVSRVASAKWRVHELSKFVSGRPGDPDATLKPCPFACEG